MRTATRWIVPVLVALLPVTLVIAAPPEDGGSGKVKGEVVAVRQMEQTRNQGEVTEIQVQLRNRERVWLRLGPQAEFGDQVQVGDRVKAQYRNQGEGEPGLVQNMYNYRTQARIQVRNDQGELIPVQQQTRMRAGYGQGSGPGDCNGTQQQVRERQGQGQGGAGKGGGGKGGGRGGR